MDAPDQRKRVVQRFMAYQLSGETNSSPHAPCEQQSSTSNSMHQDTKAVSINVSTADCGIETVPLITLEGIWNKANALLQDKNAISPAPGSDRRAHVVLSYHSETPSICV